MTSKIVVLLFAVLALTSAHQLGKSRKGQMTKEMNSEAHYQSLKDSAFGKNLFNMMSLKFKYTGQVDKIYDLLDSLGSNIADQQAADDADTAVQTQAFQETIDAQNEAIVDAEGKINSWTQQIRDDTDAHSQSVRQRDSYVAQAENIEAFLQRLAETRAQENALYLSKVEDYNAIIAGIDEVTQLFIAELENDENIDGDAAEAVLDALNELRAEFEEYLVVDTQAENDAQISYNNFRAEQTELLEELDVAITDLDTKIEGLEAEIASLTTGVDDQTVRRDNAVELKDATQAKLDKKVEVHTHDTQVRTSQTVLINQVKARLRSAQDVEGFLNN